MRRTVVVVCLSALLVLPACTASSPPSPSNATQGAGQKDGKAAPRPMGTTGTTGATGTAGTSGTAGSAAVPDSPTVEPTAARGDGGGAEPAAPQLTVTPANAPALDLVPVATDAFTMALPAGWVWETVGEYASFGIRAHDPAHPCRQVFFYSTMEPFIKSEAARAAYQASAAATDGPSYAQMYADAPVLSPRTTRQFFSEFDRYTAFARAYGIDHTFASLADLEIVEVHPLRTPIADYTVDDAVVRGSFTDGGTACEGLFGASVFDGGPRLVQGVDTSPLSVYNVMGVAAQGDELGALEDTLARSLATLAYTDAYVQAAQDADDSGAMLAHGQTMTAAYDSFTAAWAARQTLDDAPAQSRPVDGYLSR